MKNLCSFFYEDSFNYKNKERLEEIHHSLKIQVEDALKYGWETKDILIWTNFPFNHLGVKNHTFSCPTPKNLFFSKIIAAFEAISMFGENTIIWGHDHDTRQIRNFNFENYFQSYFLKNNCDILLSDYGKNNSFPQGASIFYNGMSSFLKDSYDMCLNYDKENITDEDLILYFKDKGYNISLELDYMFNTSISRYTHKIRKSKNPVAVHGDFRRKFVISQYNNLINKDGENGKK